MSHPLEHWCHNNNNKNQQRQYYTALTGKPAKYVNAMSQDQEKVRNNAHHTDILIRMRQIVHFNGNFLDKAEENNKNYPVTFIVAMQ